MIPQGLTPKGLVPAWFKFRYLNKSGTGTKTEGPGHVRFFPAELGHHIDRFTLLLDKSDWGLQPYLIHCRRDLKGHYVGANRDQSVSKVTLSLKTTSEGEWSLDGDWFEGEPYSLTVTPESV